MSLSSINSKRTIESSASLPKRQKLNSVDQRIEEMLRNPQTRSRYRNLFIRWHKMEDRPLPRCLLLEPLSSRITPLQKGDNFLHLALRSQDYQLIKQVLLEQKALPAEKNAEGVNAFALAISISSTKVHELFVKMRLRDEEGNTFLHYYFSAHPTHSKPFSPFIAARPDLTLRNLQDKTCYDIAIEHLNHKGYRQMMDYLAEQGQPIPKIDTLSEEAQNYLKGVNAFYVPRGQEKLFSHLPFADLFSLRLVNRRATKSIDRVIMKKIQELGLEAKDVDDAKAQVKRLVQEVHRLRKNERLPFRFNLARRLDNLDAMFSLSFSEVCYFLSNERNIFVQNPYVGEYESPFVSLLNNRVPHFRKQDFRAETSAAAVTNVARYGQTALLKFLLENGASVQTAPPLDCPHRNKEPGLHATIERKDIAAFSLLLKHGADVNEFNGYSRETPLSQAIREQSETMVQALLEHNANPNLRVSSQISLQRHAPLALAKSLGNQNIIQLLLDHGATEWIL